MVFGLNLAVSVLEIGCELVANIEHLGGFPEKNLHFWLLQPPVCSLTGTFARPREVVVPSLWAGLFRSFQMVPPAAAHFTEGPGGQGCPEPARPGLSMLPLALAPLEGSEGDGRRRLPCESPSRSSHAESPCILTVSLLFI